MADHAYFSAEGTTVGIPKVGKRIGIYFGDAPEKLPTGGERFFMRFPVLILSECAGNADQFAELVAQVLTENADRFSEQARRLKEERVAAIYGDGDGAGAA